MFRKLKKTIIVVSLVLWMPLLSLQINPLSKDSTLNDVFNTNCLQMTQSQQMLKAYIMKGLQSTFDDPSGSLEKAIPVYDKRFTHIKSYFQSRLKKSPKAVEAFNQAQKIWEESKKILEDEPTKEGALKLKSNFSKMIPLLLQGSKPAAKGGLELLSLTGKLCRGPMKITIDYLLKLWGVNLPDYEADVQNIMANFHNYLKELKGKSINNDHTRKLLGKIQTGFVFYEVMYNAKKRFVPNLLSRKADDNFKLIRMVKAEYRKQLK